MADKEPAGYSSRVWNWLTIVCLAAAVLVSMAYLLIFVQPSLVSDEAKAKPTRVALVVFPTLLPTFTPMPITAPVLALDTRTATPTPTPSLTPTPRNTGTPTPFPGPTSTFWPSRTPRPPTETVGPPQPTRSNYPFALLNNDIVFTSNFANAAGCAWLGIAGQVFDVNDNPLPGIAVVLIGGGPDSIVVYSGTAPAYGEAGWEHYLDNHIKQGHFTIQLYHHGQPVSDPIAIDTVEDCRANLVLVYFKQNWTEYTP